MADKDNDLPQSVAVDKKRKKTEDREIADVPKKKFKNFQSRGDSRVHKQKAKPDWKELKKKKLELKKKRKESRMVNYNYEVVTKAKKLWEEMRQENCPAEKRSELVTALYSLIKDHIVKMVFAHDTCRIIQWLLKLGTSEIRTSVIRTLLPSILLMVQKRYSSICVKRMLKYGSNADRELVLDELQGDVVKLMSHSVAAPVVDYAYENWMSSSRRMIFLCKFSGEYYKLVLETGRKVRSVKDIISISPEVKLNVLDKVKSSLLHILNKGLVFSRLIQAVVIEYLSVCSKEDEDEIYALLRPHILDLIRTREGVHLSVMCCWKSAAKDKKKFLKGLKGHVVQTALMEHGHLFLLAVLDSVDDTVALKKCVLKELIGDVLTVAANEYGRRVILYTVVHRDPMYFHPRTINFLEGGDSSTFVKKPMSVRSKEIQEAVLPSYLESVVSHVSIWFLNGSMAMVALAVLRDGSGEEWIKAINTVVKFMCEDHWVLEGGKKFALVEHSGCHLVFKKLIQQDHKNLSRTETFSLQLAKELNEEIILKWVEYNRACFLLVVLFESGVESAVETLRKKFSDRVLNKVMQQTSVGAKILLKHLGGE